MSGHRDEHDARLTLRDMDEDYQILPDEDGGHFTRVQLFMHEDEPHKRGYFDFRVADADAPHRFDVRLTVKAEMWSVEGDWLALDGGLLTASSYFDFWVEAQTSNGWQIIRIMLALLDKGTERWATR